MTFGQRVQEARKRRGLSLQVLAARVGCSSPYLCWIEMGKVNPPRPPLIRRLSACLGFDETQALLQAYLEKCPDPVRRRAGAGRVSGPARSSFPAGALPLLNAAGQAYPCRLDARGMPVPLTPESVMLPGVSGDACYALTVCGDDLEEAGWAGLRRGDIALISRRAPARNGDLVFAVAKWKGRWTGLLRRVTLLPGKDLVLHASRPAVPSRMIPRRHVRLLHPVIGRVVFRGGSREEAPDRGHGGSRRRPAR
jgi:transcriptional regulator with XRE-family HTH domain